MGKRGTMTAILALAVVIMGSAAALAERGGGPPGDMIEQHDQDGDGKISKDEFPGPDDHFTRIDLDDDGFISRTEAQQSPRPDTGQGRVPGKFQEDDANGDGVVSREEFSGPADHFDRLDLNGDSAIQENEATQGPPGRARQERGGR